MTVHPLLAEALHAHGGLERWRQAGLTWSPVDDITFRVTRSRDIRAPTMGELFQSPLALLNTVSIPANTTLNPTNTAVSRSVFAPQSGSSTLKPEVANTFGVGVVLKPSFLPGFGASIDYYRIDIQDAIITPTAQNTIDQCNQGDAASCQRVNLAASPGVVSVNPVNFARQLARGIDFEASYRQDLANISSGLKGALTLRFLGTRFLENTLNSGIPGVPVYNNVGYEYIYGAAPPKFKYSINLVYEGGPLLASVTMRGISAGTYNPSYIECTSSCPAATLAHPTIEDNHVPGATYFDTSFTYKLPGGFEAYLAVDNLLNKDPVMVAVGPSIGQAPLSVNPNNYDVLGRTFRLGVRFKLK
ncbi:TonB-dependent receptor [Sphingobium sp. CFD-2]|uniref:TonB-dependent receptor n=1 Tax=Sphingobium sp. CFD-2 TaxID=2878542 RepID=UPI00214C0415|nr:TonB-dependent receptor [Sphingobium sp. CFD-2]